MSEADEFVICCSNVVKRDGDVVALRAGRKPLARSTRVRFAEIMIEAPHVRQCPYCELRFVYFNEVKDHIVHDHPEHAAGFLSVELHELPQS